MAAGPTALSHKDMGGLKVVNLADGTAGTDGVNKGQLDTAETNAKSRANHTGTQPASTISDFDTQVRTSRLDQMAAPTSSVNANNQRVTNVGSASADTDAASWGQVKDLIGGRRKADVRAVAVADITLSGTQTIDGVSLVASDRVLLTGQTAPAENGIYVVAAGAWSRATDADAADEFATQWLVSVREGTANGDTIWQHTTDGTITLGTTAIEIEKLGPLVVESGGYTTTCPSVSAGGSWVVTHNLNSRYVLVQVARVASPYDVVDVRVERTSANTITVKPDVALSSGEYEAMVLKVA